MKKLHLIAAILVCHCLSGQNWEYLPGVWYYGIQDFYEDTTNNRLIAYGGFDSVGTIRASGIAAWDGDSWSTLPGMPTLASNQSMGVNTLVKYNGDLYMGCSVESWAQGVGYLARYNGTSFDSVARFATGVPDPLFEYQGDLIAVTHWPNDTVNGVPFTGVARWDGTTWSDMGQGAFTASIIDGLAYNGEIYVCQLGRVLRYSNGSWQQVGQMFGGVIIDLCVYNGELYAGSYNNQTSSPTNALMKLDTITDTWIMFGGGLSSSINAGWSQVDRMVVSDGALYVVGVFDHAGGALCPVVAKWDGNTWCSLGVDLNTYQCRSIGTFRDTIYVSTGIIFDNDSSDNFVKWIGGNYLDTCGVTGLNDQPLPFNTFNVYPNPASGEVTFETTGINDGVIRLYDGLGREVWNQFIIGSQTVLDAHGYPPGIYFYRLEQNGTVVESGKLILD